MKRLSRISFALLALALVACGGKQQTSNGDNGDTKPPDAGVVAPVEDLGVAADSTVLAEDGAHIQLASAWINSHAVIIFLRGHW